MCLWSSSCALFSLNSQVSICSTLFSFSDIHYAAAAAHILFIASNAVAASSSFVAIQPFENAQLFRVSHVKPHTSMSLFFSPLFFGIVVAVIFPLFI